MESIRNRKLKIQELRVLVPCIALAVLTIFNITGIIRIALLLLCLIPYIVSSPSEELIPLFFFVGFAADINVTIAGIPYITILQVVFVGKVLGCHGIRRKFIIIVMIITCLQMYALAFCGLTAIRLITFILNLLLMYSIGFGLRIDKGLLSRCYESFIFGMAVVLLASIRRDPMFFSGVYYRFKGIWPDQNFLALFCGIACLLIYYSWIRERKNYVLSAILATLFCFCGYRTYSMTFIFCVALVLGIMIIDLLISNVKSIYKIIALIVIVVLGAFVFSTIYSGVIEGRGRAVYEAGTDWTHGRFRDTGMVISAWQKNIGNILFGFGVNNSTKYVQVAAHNTYAEIVSQTGVFGTILLIVTILLFCVEYKVKPRDLLTLQNGFLLIFLFYMATLSMESTDLLYLLLGIFIFNCRNNFWEQQVIA